MNLQEVGTFEVKTHLSKYLERVAHGETIYITKHGKRVAELKPIIEKQKPKRGSGKGAAFWMSPDFDDPLPEFVDYT
jgi:prevent-host-death family protein